MATAPDPSASADTTKPQATPPSNPPPPAAVAGLEDEPEKLDPRVALRRQFHEALRSRMHDHIDKDGSYFSYMFLDKLLNSTKRCQLCGAKESGKLPDSDMSLELFVAETGVVGRQNLECTKCKRLYTVTSCENPDEIPSNPRLSIQGMEIRYYCKRITHYEVLHDLMEMLHIAATDDDKLRREKHAEVADFMLRNARRVCEEWCKAEYVELRLKKYLRLRDETLLPTYTYNPTFTPDCTDEYKEMYEMMANSFRQNRRKVVLLLELMKESLVDNPTRPSFMMWVSIAMMHSENYHQFKAMYDPRSFMRVDSTEYQALKDRYLALDVPLGVKKIPVVFMLFEIPRFYHFVDFLSRRLGKRRPRSFLTDDDQAKLARATEESKRLGIKRKPRSGKLVSPEAHLDFLTRQEEMEREMLFQSCREKERKKEKAKSKPKRCNITPAPPPPPPQESRYLAVIPREQPPRPVCMSKDDFKSMLYDHLKANEASVASGRLPGLPSNFPPIPPADTQPTPSYIQYSTLELPLPPIPPPKVRPPPPTQPQPGSSSSGKKSKKDAKEVAKAKPPGDFDDPTKTVLVAQIDSEILRSQGYTISEEGRNSTVVASRNNVIEYILEGFPNSDEVKAYLSMKYKALQKEFEEEEEKANAAASADDTPTSSDSGISLDGSSGKKKRARKKKKKKKAATSSGDVSDAKDDSVTAAVVSTTDSEKSSDKTGSQLATDTMDSPLRKEATNTDSMSPLNGGDAGTGAHTETGIDVLENSTSYVQGGKGDSTDRLQSPPATTEPSAGPKTNPGDPLIKAAQEESRGVGEGVYLGKDIFKLGGAVNLAGGNETVFGGIATKQDQVSTAKNGSSGDSEEDVTDRPDVDGPKSKKTARDKFKTCENCQLVISERIQVCAGCKKVAYCNYRCQKAHWKVHKKTCSYALKKDAKDRTG